MEETPKKLFNISTGKAATEPIHTCLLGVQERGQAMHKDFVSSCIDDPDRFECPIKKEKLATFKENGKVNKRAPDKRIASLVCTRDLMGRLVIIACHRKLDLEHVFSYPLTPVPLSMCNTDGLMVKTEKSNLLHLLESKVRSTMPRSIDAVVIDGMFLLHVLPPHIPGTYGALAAVILRQVTALSNRRVHLVFDAYPVPSIKDSERALRGMDQAEEMEYTIAGPEQHRPRKIGDSLQSRSFKEQLPKFLAVEWTSPEYADIIEGRQVYLSYLGACFRFYVIDGRVIREDVEALKTNHEEADTLICTHVSHIDKDNAMNIVVRASDTDVAIILLNHCERFNAHIWMDIGTSANNNRRYVDVSSISRTLGTQLCRALPGFHAFTGSDYTSAFYKKGKKRPFKILEESQAFQKAFGEMAGGKLRVKAMEEIMTFTARMYGAKAGAKANHETHLNTHRFKVFEKSYAPKATAKNPLEKLKGIDAAMIPPCEAEVTQQIKRATFVAKMWADAHEKMIQQQPTKEDGWDLQGNVYEVLWFDGPQVPESLAPNEGETSQDEDEEDMDFEQSSSDEEGITSDEDE
jgi:hypothetical protein